MEESSVVVYEGMPVAELTGLLRCGFSAAGAAGRDPVALRSPQGVLVPLSAAARYPVLVRGGDVYTLVVYAAAGSSGSSPDAVGNGVHRGRGGSSSGAGAAGGTGAGAGAGAGGDDDDEDERELSPAGEEATADAVREQLLEFVAALHAAGSLSDAEADAVASAVLADDAAVGAAYAAAAAAADVRTLSAALVAIGRERVAVRRPSNPTPEQSELTRVVRAMRSEGSLSSSEEGALAGAIAREDEEVMAAWEEYDAGDGGEAALRITLTRVARLRAGDAPSSGDADDEAEQTASAGAAAVAAAPASRAAPAAAAGAVAAAAAGAPTGTPTAESLTQLVGVLEAEAYASAGEVHALRDAIAAREPRLYKAYERFVADDNFHELLRTVMAVAARLEPEQGVVPEDEAEAEAVALEQQVGGMHALLVRRMRDAGEVTLAEANLLRRMYVAGEPMVRAAWSVFLSDGDEGELRDTLLRVVARATARARVGVAADAARASAIVTALHEQGALSAGEARGVIDMLAAGNTVVTGAMELFESDEDAAELVETLKMAVRVRAAEDEAGGDVDDMEGDLEEEEEELSEEEEEEGGGSPSEADAAFLRRFVAALYESGEVKSGAANALLRLVAARDPRLWGAYDVFREETDSEDFADTLAVLGAQAGAVAATGTVRVCADVPTCRVLPHAQQLPG